MIDEMTGRPPAARSHLAVGVGEDDTHGEVGANYLCHIILCVYIYI